MKTNCVTRRYRIHGVLYIVRIHIVYVVSGAFDSAAKRKNIRLPQPTSKTSKGESYAELHQENHKKCTYGDGSCTKATYRLTGGVIVRLLMIIVEFKGDENEI